MKLRLVDDARRWWRWGSVHLAAGGALAAGVLLNVHDAAGAALSALPDWMRASLPAWLPMAMLVVPIAARLLTLRKKDGGNG